jgi:hypothetical protein
VARKLVLLIALLATLVVLGCWDNRRQIQRVLDDGYATTAQVTGAQYQRKLPLAADGWRPRFVEQELSVDLGWQGRDGKAQPSARCRSPSASPARSSAATRCGWSPCRSRCSTTSRRCRSSRPTRRPAWNRCRPG